MSNDLISREALKKDFDISFFNDEDDYKKALRIIDNAPTVNPCYQTTSCLDCKNYDKENHNCPRYCEVIKEAINPRPQGEWKYNQYDGNPNIGNWHCSECRHIVFGGYSQKPYYNFCPNCGAKMRGKA